MWGRTLAFCLQLPVRNPGSLQRSWGLLFPCSSFRGHITGLGGHLPPGPAACWIRSERGGARK